MKNREKMYKKARKKSHKLFEETRKMQGGITLIALVITIVLNCSFLAMVTMK